MIYIYREKHTLDICFGPFTVVMLGFITPSEYNEQHIIYRFDRVKRVIYTGNYRKSWSTDQEKQTVTLLQNIFQCMSSVSVHDT